MNIIGLTAKDAMKIVFSSERRKSQAVIDIEEGIRNAASKGLFGFHFVSETLSDENFKKLVMEMLYGLGYKVENTGSEKITIYWK